MPDKPKAKTPRQVSLLDAQEDKPDELDRMVAQAFDSDPSVRLRVANSLAKTDDPRAIFALIELSADKDEEVKEAAQRSLGNFKDEKEEIVSIGKLLSERKAQPYQAPGAPQTAPQKAMRANMMPAIERLFAHYEPKKRESVKRKLFPSLQKLFGFRPEELDPLRELDKISGGQQPAREGGPQNAENFPFEKHEEPSEPRRRAETEVEVSEEDTEMVGEHHVHMEEEEEPLPGVASPDEIYHYALRIATTPGMGKVDLKREQNRLIADFKRRADLAFKLASAQAKEEGCATFSGVKPGMKSLSFSEMAVSSMTEISYGARRKPYTRIMLFDGKREMALLAPRERAHGIAPSDRLALKKVAADFIVEKNEVVLIASGKSSIIIYK